MLALSAIRTIITLQELFIAADFYDIQIYICIYSYLQSLLDIQSILKYVQLDQLSKSTYML